MQDTKKSFLMKSKFEWVDLKPLPQYDGNPPIFNFQYPQFYAEMMGYFRAVVHNKEISERVFELTGFVVQQICGNYSAWFLRRKCIEELNLNLEEELDFVEKNMSGNEKVYQIWEHRRWIVEKMNKPLKEIKFIDQVLSADNKNYHAWSYRKWLVDKFDLYEEEFKALEFYLEQDIRNNSAWNQRFFVCQHFIELKKIELKSEIQFCLDKLKIAPDNESAWNYLNGWFKSYNFKALEPKDPSKIHLNVHLCVNNILDFKEIEEFTKLIISKEEERCRFAYSTLINIYLISGEKENILKAIEMVDKLCEIDFTRKTYWEWFKANVQTDFLKI